MTNYAKAAIAAMVALALFFGYRAIANHYTEVGKAEVQAKWNADKVARKAAEDLAVADRNAENERLKGEQRKSNETITEKYNAELTKVRNDLATAKRMRVGTAICGQGSSAPAKAGNAEGGITADNATWGIREDAERDLRALELRVEESFATGRTCQGWGVANGFAN